MRGAAILGVCILLGAGLAFAQGITASGFWAAGEPIGQDILVGEPGYGRWDFQGLAGLGEQFVLQVAVVARNPGELLPVCLRLTAPAMDDWRLYRLSLKRISGTSERGVYFGQLCFSRRDLRLGSQLSVRLDLNTPAALIWANAQSVVLLTGMATPSPLVRVREAEYGGWAPSSAGQVRKASPAPTGTPFPLVHTLPETERPQEAAYIAPGTYTGTIGWPGPGSPPDSSDWFKINVRPGQRIRISLRAEDGTGCGLALYDANWQQVAVARVGYELAIEYLVEDPGPWLIQVTCRDPGRMIEYALTWEIMNRSPAP